MKYEKIDNNLVGKLTVLVTGVTGNQGGAVARELLKKGHKVKGFTRNLDSDKALKLKELGVRLIKGSFDDPASIEFSLQGADAAYLMGSPFMVGVENETLQGIRVVGAAKRVGLKHLLYCSVGSAHKSTGIPHFESKYKVEEHIRKSGVPYTIIRPAFFMENFYAPFNLPDLKKGIRAAPMPPDRKLAMISVKDIGKFAVHIFEHSEQFIGKAIDIASDNISGKESAEIFSRIIGKPIEYREQKYEDIAMYGEDMVSMYKWFNEIGYNIDVNELRSNLPDIGWHCFEDWVKEQNWTVLDD